MSLLDSRSIAPTLASALLRITSALRTTPTASGLAPGLTSAFRVTTPANTSMQLPSLDEVSSFAKLLFNVVHFARGRGDGDDRALAGEEGKEVLSQRGKDLRLGNVLRERKCPENGRGTVSVMCELDGATSYGILRQRWPEGI